jgi:hypothetical protein
MPDVSIQTDEIFINSIPLATFLQSKPRVDVDADTNHNDKNELYDDIWNIDSDETSDDDDDANKDNTVTDANKHNKNETHNDGCDNSHIFTNDELELLTESVFECIHHLVQINPLLFSDPEFHSKMERGLYEILDANFSDILQYDFFNFTEAMECQFEEVVQHCLDEYFSTVVPPRSYPNSLIMQTNNPSEITRKIEYLNSIPQAEQRTPGWYMYRYNLITASSAWKVFKSESTINQLIYEKCKPLNIDLSSAMCNDDNNLAIGYNNDDIDVEKNMKLPSPSPSRVIDKSYVNTNSPLHWGQKYEKLSVMIYELKNNTKIGEFGCIKHPKYDFLGASPDGINIDPSSPLYGRLLEIKNIVNREINGIPLEEYWVQTQLQMQVCDFDECDFLETLFKEYEDEEAFLNDSASDIDTEFHLTSSRTIKGVISYFMKDGKPYYQYAPLQMTHREYEKWCEEIIDKNANITWLKNIYWYLEKYSCVLIRKNDIWFESAIGKIDNVWKIILNERNTGYEHRAPKKRIAKKKNNNESNIDSISLNEDAPGSGCLIIISDLELNI